MSNRRPKRAGPRSKSVPIRPPSAPRSSSRGHAHTRKPTSPARKRRPQVVGAGSDDVAVEQAPLVVLRLIRDIQSGATDPTSLSPESRRACVEYLTSEGYSVPEIGQILKASDRTVARDRALIRQANAVDVSPELTKQAVGNMLREAENVISRIRRATRDKSVSVADRIMGEKTVWDVLREVIQLMQRLGYLPSAPYLVQGQFVHQSLDGSAAHLQEEVTRIERIISTDATLATDPALVRIAKKTKSTVRALVAAPSNTSNSMVTDDQERAP